MTNLSDWYLDASIPLAAVLLSEVAVSSLSLDLRSASFQFLTLERLLLMLEEVFEDKI
jgi:hypothetical protein